MYKIIEFEPNRFKLYRKIWCFWVTVATPHMGGGDTFIYTSDKEVIDAMNRDIQNCAEAARNRRFKKIVTYYSDNGKEIDMNEYRGPGCGMPG